MTDPATETVKARELCLAALAASEAGRAAETRTLLRKARRVIERAVRRAPREGWPLALRAQARLLSGDEPGADADLDAAVLREPVAWILRLRASRHESAGRLPHAIEDLRRALRLAPGDADPRRELAHALSRRKRHDEAVTELGRALRLRPSDPDLLARRADALWLAGRPGEAARDLEACARLAPGDETLRFKAARLELFAGINGLGRRELARWRRSSDARRRALASRLDALADLRARRWKSAARRLGTLERAGGPSSSELGSSPAVNRRLALGMEAVMKKSRKPANGREPVLIMSGLGLDFPNQVTLETLAALSSCDLVLNNLADPETMEFLSLFCRDVRAISFDGADPEQWADAVLKTLRPGTRAAFVTRGHPLVSGHLAHRLLTRAKRRGVRVVSYGALSSIDQMLALAQEALGETSWGVQVYDARLLLDGTARLQTGLPAILNLGVPDGPATARRRERSARDLGRHLSALYPKSHRALLFGPRYDLRRLEETKISALGERLVAAGNMLSSLVVLVPPLGRSRPPRYDGSTAPRNGA